jgi:hypothetical protein
VVSAPIFFPYLGYHWNATNMGRGGGRHSINTVFLLSAVGLRRRGWWHKWRKRLLEGEKFLEWAHGVRQNVLSKAPQIRNGIVDRDLEKIHIGSQGILNGL